MPVVKNLQQHKLLLDTHIWIWLMGGNPILSPSFCKAIQRSQQHDGIFISAISVWEIGMLVAKKKIAFEMDCMDWVEQSLANPGIRLLPLLPRIAIESTRLPGIVHADPADRMLIATAHEECAVLVTCDNKILEYGKDNYVNVHNPCQ